MKETEITVQVFDSFENIDRILKQNGFESTRKFKLHDSYFTTISDVAGVDFKHLIDNSILVREITDDKIVGQLMYKKKNYDDAGNVISEEKTKVIIDDFDKTVKILTLAGLNNYVQVKNSSIVYKDDKMEICLQVVENLGIFIEYEEDESVKNLTEQEKIEIMTGNLKSLGLKLGEDYSCKKVEMLLNK